MRIEDQFDMDALLHQRDSSPAVSNIILAAGVLYRVEFDGSWSGWGDGSSGDGFNRTFPGPGENAPPKYHSPGRIPQKHSQFNAEWEFGDNNPPVHHHGGIEWSLDGGSTYVHNVEPLGGIGVSWNATNHVYQYELVGQGHALRCRGEDNRRFENDGIIKVTIYGEGGWVVGAVAAG